MSTTKTGTVRSVPLASELAKVLGEHRTEFVARQAPGLAEGWVFPSAVAGCTIHPFCGSRSRRPSSGR